MLAWLAGEEWKLQAFRDYDAGTGPDLYKLAYSKSFGVPVDDVDKGGRQVGKTQELALGYAGGVGAFVTFAMTYRMDLADIAESVLAAAPDWADHEANEFYDWMVKKGNSTFGLPRHIYVACEIVKRLWRAAHPSTTALWKGVEEAVKAAVAQPGRATQYLRLKFRRDGSWLRVRLPSGRYLCYPAIKVEDGKISYSGVDQYTKKWQRIHTHGGKFVENFCQAAARDVLAYNMPLVEAAGYEIVLHVHDEIIAEVPDTPDFSGEGLADLMATNQEWSEGLPLAAEGFETQRYRK